MMQGSLGRPGEGKAGGRGVEAVGFNGEGCSMGGSEGARGC